jgi:hypothetical protein
VSTRISWRKAVTATVVEGIVDDVHARQIGPGNVPGPLEPTVIDRVETARQLKSENSVTAVMGTESMKGSNMELKVWAAKDEDAQATPITENGKRCHRGGRFDGRVP